MKKSFSFMLLFLPFLFSCEKVSDLSDNAYLESFSIISYEPAQAHIQDVSIEPNTVLIEVLPQEQLFPLSLRASIKTNSGTDDVLGFPDVLIFNSGTSNVNFHLIAESGVPQPYRVVLKPLDTGADIVRFELSGNETANTSVAISSWDRTIRISRSKLTFPLTLHPDIALSKNATIEGDDSFSSLTFNKVTDKFKMNVISAEGVEREWSIFFESNTQLPNSDFELWIEERIGKKDIVNIDPTPVKGKGWATANNSYVQGTTPFSFNNGLVAQMETRIQDVPITHHELIAAGTLYTGFFTLSLDFENPRQMTNFGIPHNLRVDTVAFDAKYIAGEQLMQAIREASEGDKYRVRNIDGHDNGQAWVELLHWSGEGELQYHGKPLTGLKVLGRGEFVFHGDNKEYQNWNRIKMPVIYENTPLTPTHIAVVFSSSKDGEFFRGAPGSKLWVDNVELIYK